jgi:hypothetical protein
MVNRLASNSTTVKDWAVALVAALLTVAVLSQRGGIAFVALLPSLVFWGLDTYYLRQERLFRNLYRAVQSADDESPVALLSMDTRQHAAANDGFFRLLLRPPLSVFYGAILAAAVAAAIMLNV